MGFELPGCYVHVLFSGAALVQLAQGSRSMLSNNLTKSSKGLNNAGDHLTIIVVVMQKLECLSKLLLENNIL